MLAHMQTRLGAGSSASLRSGRNSSVGDMLGEEVPAPLPISPRREFSAKFPQSLPYVDA